MEVDKIDRVRLAFETDTVVAGRSVGTHSLRRQCLGVSDLGRGTPEFIPVGCVDSYPITTYNSVSRVKEPQAPWMAEHLTPDRWEKDAQLLRVGSRSSRWNRSDAGRATTITQVVSHLPEDDWPRVAGSTRGFLQYDGQGFTVFSNDTLSWTAADNAADVTRRVWEAEQHELQYQKHWLEEEGTAWLKSCLGYGKDTLRRTESETISLVINAVSGSLVLTVALAALAPWTGEDGPEKVRRRR
ncbi:major histocompatibility complex, class I-related [Phyllostomus discolor]|uniref:Major histocompatibility complex, class I-related n=1 Tax=Phyllostomus discolor TaxID=89673 RepID=A0A834DCY5_9CHIR|nr:major histocompatibility complex, class I-related [Phyllostomus discolor]